MKQIRKKACNSCPFEGKDPLKLSDKKMSEILDYTLKGTNHLCHCDRTGATVCRGARNLFLKFQYLSGNISQPTDEALSEAMRECGISPCSHINNGIG